MATIASLWIAAHPARLDREDLKERGPQAAILNMVCKKMILEPNTQYTTPYISFYKMRRNALMFRVQTISKERFTDPHKFCASEEDWETQPFSSNSAKIVIDFARTLPERKPHFVFWRVVNSVGDIIATNYPGEEGIEDADL